MTWRLSRMQMMLRRPSRLLALLAVTLTTEHGYAQVPPSAASDQAASVAESTAIEEFSSALLLTAGPSLGALQDGGTQYVQPEADLSDIEPPEWRFDLYAAAWLPVKVKGSVLAGTSEHAIDIDLETILDDLEMVFEGGFQFTNDEWSILVWAIYVGLQTDSTAKTPVGSFTTTLDLKETIVDVALARRIGTWDLGTSENATWAVDVLGGFRYWWVQVDIDEYGPVGLDPTLGIRETWIDLNLGARVLFQFTENFSGSVRGDIGGFGIGTSSDLTWIITAIGQYNLSPNFSLVFGYRYLDIDWDRGTGDQRLGFDYFAHGPILGARIEF